MVLKAKMVILTFSKNNFGENLMMNQIHVYAHKVHGRRSVGLGVKEFARTQSILEKNLRTD